MDMLAYANWIFYKLVWNDQKGKYEKYPMNPRTGGLASSTDPATWGSWSEVRHAWDNARPPEAAGIGFTLDNNPFWCIDLDGVYDPVAGVWDSTAVAVMSMFPGGAGVYMEWSVSGKGVHIFGVGQKPPGVGSKSADRKIEIYDSGRFIAMTFNTIAGSWSGMTDHTNTLANICAIFLPPKQSGSDGPSAINWGCGPVVGYDGPADDDALIQMMMTDVIYNFNRTVSIPDLWNKNEVVLSERFPEEGSRGWDHSAADLSLMNAIADFTGDDPDRMDRIFRRSGLFREERWEESRFNYRNRTILKALARPTRKVFKAQSVVAPVIDQGGVAVGGGQTSFGEILTPQEQQEFFKGCVYVMSRNEIFLPNGTFVKPDTFKSGFYAGHLFIIDLTGNTTANAWEAFTQNRAVKFPKVMRMCFRPDLQPGVINLDDEWTLNTYIPVVTKRVYGADVSRFTGHLKKMFPNDRDREIITCFMAAVVQHPGIKFQWCPVIQGTEGNGKSMLIRAITAAIGERYTHSVNSATLADGGGKFNKWLEGKLFIDFEEIYTGDRMDMMEILKPIVTNPRLEIQGKGMDQYTGDNRANMMMATNHKNAILKTAKDRRYAVIYSAQQSYEDCLRDGMDDDYFSSIYNWLKSGGYAEVAGWLATYPIPDALNPATMCQRAPVTSSMGEAIRESLGVVEQHIMEWVDTDRPGFRGGWISSAKLEDALKEAGLAGRVAPNRRKAILEALGYQQHPNLVEGKCPIELMAEGGKRPRLYAKGDLLRLSDKTAICAAYCTAQGYGN